MLILVIVCLFIYSSVSLSIYPSVYTFACQFVSISIHLSVYLHISLNTHLSICFSNYPSLSVFIYLSTNASIYLSVHQSIHPSIYIHISFFQLYIKLITFSSLRNAHFHFLPFPPFIIVPSHSFFLVLNTFII